MFKKEMYKKRKPNEEYGFLIYNKASELPELWDEIAKENCFLKREFLGFLEEVNPCKQRYHINIKEEIILVDYSLKIDIFTFKKGFSLKFPINIVGIPLSVSSKGYYYMEDKGDILSDYIKKTMKAVILLNSDDKLKLTKGHTLSDFELSIRWSSFEDYLKSMRSHYRYRTTKALKKFECVRVEAVSRNEFSKNLYRFYEEVYERSNSKLEKLSIDYFKKLPANILVFKDDDRELGFVQLKEAGNKLYFLFCGFDEDLNKEYDLYLNMIFHIIKYSIDHGFRLLSLGQTTEDIKSKAGAYEIEKYLYFSSKYKVIDLLGNIFIKTLSYKRQSQSYRVFKA